MRDLGKRDLVEGERNQNGSSSIQSWVEVERVAMVVVRGEVYIALREDKTEMCVWIESWVFIVALDQVRISILRSNVLVF